MKKILYTLSLLLYPSIGLFAQVEVLSPNNAFWLEHFDTSTSGWQLNVVTGPEGADPNFWVIDDFESGRPADSCQSAGNTDQTLYIASEFIGAIGGASYDAGGLCGITFCPMTSRQVESPIIDCTGRSNIYLQFNYIENGNDTLDNAGLYFNDSTGWVLLDDMPKSAIGCGSGSMLAIWEKSVVILPSSAENNPNVQIAFRWENNDDGIGNNPSIAINDVYLSEGPLVLSSEDIEAHKSPNVFPNPTQGKVFVDGNYMLMLSDITGRILKQENLSSSIDLEGLSQGLYFLLILDENKNFKGCEKIRKE